MTSQTIFTAGRNSTRIIGRVASRFLLDSLFILFVRKDVAHSVSNPYLFHSEQFFHFFRGFYVQKSVPLVLLTSDMILGHVEFFDIAVFFKLVVDKFSFQSFWYSTDKDGKFLWLVNLKVLHICLYLVFLFRVSRIEVTVNC